MGLFGWLKDEDGPDIYDEDEYDELLTDSALYFEAQKLESVCFSVSPKDVFRLDTDAVLESAELLPYEFRYYLDTRRAFANALKNCRDEIGGYVSYEGGRSAVYTASYEYDGHSVVIDFTLEKPDDCSPFTFTADITVDE